MEERIKIEPSHRAETIKLINNIEELKGRIKELQKSASKDRKLNESPSKHLRTISVDNDMFTSSPRNLLSSGVRPKL